MMIPGFNLAAHRELCALDRECGQANDLGDIAIREILATVRLRGKPGSEHQAVRNETLVKHIKARKRGRVA